jgi:hypothetical protein
MDKHTAPPAKTADVNGWIRAPLPTADVFCPRCESPMDRSQVERDSALRQPLKLWHCGNCGIRLPRFDDSP